MIDTCLLKKFFFEVFNIPVTCGKQIGKNILLLDKYVSYVRNGVQECR